MKEKREKGIVTKCFVEKSEFPRYILCAIPCHSILIFIFISWIDQQWKLQMTHLSTLSNIHEFSSFVLCLIKTYSVLLEILRVTGRHRFCIKVYPKERGTVMNFALCSVKHSRLPSRPADKGGGVGGEDQTRRTQRSEISGNVSGSLEVRLSKLEN